jgi:hypothetical protein
MSTNKKFTVRYVKSLMSNGKDGFAIHTKPAIDNCSTYHYRERMDLFVETIVKLLNAGFKPTIL